MSAETLHSEEDPKRSPIHAAAIVVFSARGFSATTMAQIAAEAGMSRPALYQYFRNKGELFASAFMALVDGAADRSQAELHAPGSIANQLDGFLQRFDGDLWERTSASPYDEDLLRAKLEYAPEAMGIVMTRLRSGLAAYLRSVSTVGRSGVPAQQRRNWIEILELSPRGLKSDQPSVKVYRRRLTALARSVASDISDISDISQPM